MTVMQMFAWASFGTFALQVAVLACHLGRPSPPKRYGRWSYWLVVLAIALCSGLLAVALSVTSPREAIVVGATFPWVVRALPRARGE